jgi:hypothetical protein
MRKRVYRLIGAVTHSYVLLALGAVFVAGIDWNFWLRYELSDDGRFIFVGGLLAVVYLAVAVTIITLIPRRDL